MPRVPPVRLSVVRCVNGHHGEEAMRAATGASLPMLSSYLEAVTDHYWEKWRTEGYEGGISLERVA